MPVWIERVNKKDKLSAGDDCPFATSSFSATPVSIRSSRPPSGPATSTIGHFPYEGTLVCISACKSVRVRVLASSRSLPIQIDTCMDTYKQERIYPYIGGSCRTEGAQAQRHTLMPIRIRKHADIQMDTHTHTYSCRVEPDCFCYQ